MRPLLGQAHLAAQLPIPLPSLISWGACGRGAGRGPSAKPSPSFHNLAWAMEPQSAVSGFAITVALIELADLLPGVSYCVSTVFNYVASMRYVFAHREGLSRTREFIIFVTLSVIGLGLNEAIMWLGGRLVGDEWYMLAKVVGGCGQKVGPRPRRSGTGGPHVQQGGRRDGPGGARRGHGRPRGERDCVLSTSFERKSHRFLSSIRSGPAQPF